MWWDSTRPYYPILLWRTFWWFPEFHSCYREHSYTCFFIHMGRHFFGAQTWEPWGHVHLSEKVPQHFQSSSPSTSTSHAAWGPEHGRRAQAAGESQPRGGGCGWGYKGLGLPAFRFAWWLHQLPRGQGGLNESRSLVWVWWCRAMPSGSSHAFFWYLRGGGCSFPLYSWFTFPLLSKTCLYCCPFFFRFYAF